MLNFKITEETYDREGTVYYVDLTPEGECEGISEVMAGIYSLGIEWTTHADALDALRMIRHNLDEAIRREEERATPEDAPRIVGTICKCDRCQAERNKS